MPVPKRYATLYGKIVGRLINSGYSPADAKAKADKAIKDRMKAKGKTKVKAK